MARARYTARAGFTLVELLIVVGILLVLAGLMFSTIGEAQGKARETACINNLRQLLAAFSMYAADNDGLLPPNPADRVPGCPLCDDEGECSFIEGHTVFPMLYDACEVYLMSAYAPYGATPEIWHCPSQPRPASAEEGKELVYDIIRRGCNVTGLNSYYRTYTYSWLPQMAPSSSPAVVTPSGVLGGKVVQEDIVGDTWLFGVEVRIPYVNPEGYPGHRIFPVGPHGPREPHEMSRLCKGYVDGHVECLTKAESERRWEELKREAGED